MPTFFDFSRKNKNKRGRISRIEKLEGREMLSVTPWALVDDVAPIMEAGSATTWSDRIDPATDVYRSYGFCPIETPAQQM